LVQNNQNPEDLYEQLSREEPLRESDESIDNGSYGDDDDRTLDDYERSNPNLTDLQALFKLLSPDFKNRIFNLFIGSRLSPEVFKAYLKLAINNEIKRKNPYKRLDVVGTSMELYTVMTKALDGKYLIELLEAYGARASNDEMDSLIKNAGLGG
jgi:hypothetical protein